MSHVLITGHSFVARLEQFIRKTNRDNFEFNPLRTQLDFCGRGGATISKLVGNGLFRKLSKKTYDLVIFEIGTCDIDNVSADAPQLALDLFRLARRCVNDFGVKSVLFCPVLPRGAGRFKAKTADFTVKAELFNNTLKRLCSRIAVPNTRMSVLKHQRFNSMLPSLLCDGVHLTPEGLQRYYFSLRRGIVAALK